MELITRALAGVIAAWIPMDAGEDRKRSLEEVRPLSSVSPSLPPSRRLRIAKHPSEATLQEGKKAAD